MAKIADPLVIGKIVGDFVDNISPTAQMSVTYNSNKQVYTGSFFTLLKLTYFPVNILIITNIPGTTDSSYGTEMVSYEMPRPNIEISLYNIRNIHPRK
ncbi:unnamed protein product [Coffea canephora]|uniref:DH200=94 genomic scaffold, scaffold_1619 n=1 Tax=Coffea canephora TaxID=49390 RepID=A0A068VJI8_COFCA|nr:unnamed protein product [Coffea canephora]